MANLIQINGKKLKDSNAASMASLAPVESSTTASMAHAVGDYFWLNGTLYEATTSISIGNEISVGTNCKISKLAENVTDLKSEIEEISQSGIDASGASDGQVPVADGQGSWAWDDPAGGGTVTDVQLNGTSILDAQGVANVPTVAYDKLGVVKVAGDGLSIVLNTGRIRVSPAASQYIKGGTQLYAPICVDHQHESTFYGLAKAAGDTTQSQSSNAVGNYTDNAKSAIHEMLNGSVAVTGTTPTITALPGIRYICGEVSTLDITLPASGIVDIVFESGSTPTVLTITPPTGVTLKWANGFDPTALDADTTYEINIADGLGVAGSWT